MAFGLYGRLLECNNRHSSPASVHPNLYCPWGYQRLCHLYLACLTPGLHPWLRLAGTGPMQLDGVLLQVATNSNEHLLRFRQRAPEQEALTSRPTRESRRRFTVGTNPLGLELFWWDGLRLNPLVISRTRGSPVIPLQETPTSTERQRLCDETYSAMTMCSPPASIDN